MLMSTARLAPLAPMVIPSSGNLSAKIKMITAELSVGSQKTIKKEDTTEEIFGYFGINILDKHFPLYGYASDETCRCIAKSSFLTRRS